MPQSAKAFTITQLLSGNSACLTPQSLSLVATGHLQGGKEGTTGERPRSRPLTGNLTENAVSVALNPEPYMQEAVGAFPHTYSATCLPPLHKLSTLQLPCVSLATPCGHHHRWAGPLRDCCPGLCPFVPVLGPFSLSTPSCESSQPLSHSRTTQDRG